MKDSIRQNWQLLHLRCRVRVLEWGMIQELRHLRGGHLAVVVVAVVVAVAVAAVAVAAEL